jgi:hypothetical protein
MLFNRRNICLFFCTVTLIGMVYWAIMPDTSPTITADTNLSPATKTKVSQHTINQPANIQQPQIIANQLPATLQDSKKTLEDIAKQAAEASSLPANAPDLTPPSGNTPAEITEAANNLIQELAASGVDMQQSKASFAKQWQATQLNPGLEQQDIELAAELKAIEQRIKKLQQPNQ